jgi:hypothetical protein
VVKSINRWVGHVACMGEEKCLEYFSGEHKGKVKVDLGKKEENIKDIS